jgi:hypothetical protein
MSEWGELSFKIVRLETAGQEVLARTVNQSSTTDPATALEECFQDLTANRSSSVRLDVRLACDGQVFRLEPPAEALCPPNGRPLPPAFADRYGGTEIGNRGGIVLPGIRMNTPLEAC